MDKRKEKKKMQDHEEMINEMADRILKKLDRVLGDGDCQDDHEDNVIDKDIVKAVKREKRKKGVMRAVMTIGMILPVVSVILSSVGFVMGNMGLLNGGVVCNIALAVMLMVWIILSGKGNKRKK